MCLQREPRLSHDGAFVSFDAIENVVAEGPLDCPSAAPSLTVVARIAPASVAVAAALFVGRMQWPLRERSNDNPSACPFGVERDEADCPRKLTRWALSLLVYPLQTQ